MVCYHDIHVTPRTRSGWIRAANRDVLKWFHDLASPSRVEFVCGLLQLFTPTELRFYGSCLEELARLHYDELRELDIQSNSVIDPKDEDCLITFFKHPSDRVCSLETAKLDLKRLGMSPLPSSFHVLTGDSFLRSKLILRLSLLRSTNFVSAQAYFEALMADDTTTSTTSTTIHPRDQTRLGGSASYPTFSSKWQNGISSDESEDEAVRSNRFTSNELKAIDEILLIYTLAAFHPAFTFDQRQRLYAYLCVLRAWSDSFRGQQSQPQQMGKQLPRPLTHNTAAVTATVSVNSATAAVGRHNSSVVCHMCGVMQQRQHPSSSSSSHACPNDEASDRQSNGSCASQFPRSGLTTACSVFATERDVPFSLHRWLRWVRRGRCLTYHRRFHSLSLEDLALLESCRTQITENQLKQTGLPHSVASGNARLVTAMPPSSPSASSVTVARPRGRSGTAIHRQEDARASHPAIGTRCSSCDAPHPSVADQIGVSATESLMGALKIPAVGSHSVKPQPPRFFLNGSDDSGSVIHDPSSGTDTDSSVAPIPLHHTTTNTEAGSCCCSSSSDDPNSTSTRTLTGSDRISMIRDLVVSTSELSLTPRTSRPDHRETAGNSTARLTGPSTSRFNPADNNDMGFHFGLGKHSKDVTDYCRLTPKRHSSGSSPISTPPSEDSGSETVAMTTTTTSSNLAYWNRKDSNVSSTTTITSIITTDVRQPPCLTCHQCQAVCLSTSVPAPSFLPSSSNRSDGMHGLTDTPQPTVISTPTKQGQQQQQQQQTQGVPGNQGRELRSASQKGCTYCRQTDSHSNCILSTSLGSEHRTCCHCYRMTNNNHTPPTHSGCQDLTGKSVPDSAAVISTGTMALPSEALQDLNETPVAPTVPDALIDQTTPGPAVNREPTKNNGKSKNCEHAVSDNIHLPGVKKPSASNFASPVSVNEGAIESMVEITKTSNSISPSTRTSSVIVCPPHVFNGTSPDANLLDATCYAQPYMIPSSNLWITPQPGAPWASVLPPCIAAAALSPHPPPQYASVSDSLDPKDDGGLSINDSSDPVACDDQLHASESVQSDSTGTASSTSSNLTHSSCSQSTQATPPATPLIAPQTFIMLYPPAPFDVFPTGLVPIDLITGQPVQYMSLNPPGAPSPSVPTALHIDSVPSAAECSSVADAASPDQRQNASDVSVIVESNTVATPTSTVISVPSATPVTVSAERQHGSRALPDQSSFPAPSTKLRSVACEPSVPSDIIQPISSWTNGDVQATLTWTNTTASLLQQQLQHRPSFRPELAAYLSSGLRMRPVSSYANRAFHAPPPQPPPHFTSTMFNGPFPSRPFLHPQLGSNNNGPYHPQPPSSSVFSQSCVNGSFVAHASSAHAPQPATSSYFVNLSGQLLSHPSTVSANYPQNPPPSLIHGRVTSVSSPPCGTLSTDVTESRPSAPVLVVSTSGFCSTSSTCTNMYVISSTCSSGIAPLSSVELGPIQSASQSTSTNSGSITSASAGNAVLPVICSATTANSNNNTTITTTTASASFHQSSAPTPPPPPSFLPNFFLHQPPLLPPSLPPPHPNYFLPQQTATPLLTAHGQAATFTVPFWPPLPMHHGPASVVGTMHAHRTVSCYNCGQPGHKAKQCPSRLPNQQALENTFNLSFAPSK